MADIRIIPSLPDYGADDEGNIWRVTKPRAAWKKQDVPYKLDACLATTGYLCVSVKSKTWRLVHRLVAEAFHENTEDKPMVAHGDGVKTNNRPSNLRWATEKENSEDRKRHGTNTPGEKNPASVLSAGDVEWIRAYPKRKGMFVEMAKRLQVHKSCIVKVYRGISWPHIGGAHPFHNN